MNNHLQQANVLAADASKKTWLATKHLSKWSYIKGKDGWAAYKRKAKRRAVLNRQEQRRLAVEKQEAREKELVADREQREIRHAEFIKTLNDDFAELKYNLSPLVKGRPRRKRMAMLDKYVGRDTPWNATFTATLANAPVTWGRGKLAAELRGGGGYSAVRSVSDLSEKEIGILRIISLMNSLMLVDNQHLNSIYLTIVFNGGKSAMLPTHRTNNDPRAYAAVEDMLKPLIQPASLGVQRGITTIGQVRNYLSTTDPHLLISIDKELNGVAGWGNTSGF